jgi:site-specific recombinase XerD
VSLPIVQAILGHSTVQVTQRYAHLAPDVMQAAMLHAFGMPAHKRR